MEEEVEEVDWQLSVINDMDFQEELSKCKLNDTLFLVELYSKWCGTCQVVKPALKTLIESIRGGVKIVCATLDIDRVVKCLRARSNQIDWSQGDDDTVPARWSRILLPWIGTAEPTFLYFRGGRLCAITEGLNLPQIEFNLEWISRVNMDIDTVTIGITQKEINTAAFVIQSKWRRNRQLGRIGLYVNGVFKTHSLLKKENEVLEAERKRLEIEALRISCVIMIQKHVRGYIGRKWFISNKKQLVQKHRVTVLRKGNQLNMTRSTNKKRAPNKY
eukprot:TRINITY_DN28052_c0_g1_i1.p1 TRINITY_DN28052_c0_g1~~TRINITY_DN28052_c0_g1_i1.p1  ORF type:complete len:274 (+),score=35.94 TRINITY_DN28052_c0_g1_i1:40-861(+)